VFCFSSRFSMIASMMMSQSQVVERGRAEQTIASLFLLFSGDRSFLGESLQRLFNGRETFLQQLLRNFAHRRFKPGTRAVWQSRRPSARNRAHQTFLISISFSSLKPIRRLRRFHRLRLCLDQASGAKPIFL